MNIFYFFYPVIILLGLFFLSQGDTEKNKRRYIYIMLFFLTAESCLRGVSIGNDTESYYYWWQNIKTTSWADIFTEFNNRYALNDSTEDIGFNVYTKFLQLFSYNFQYFLCVSALCFFIPFGKLLIRYTNSIKQLIFIFIFYVSLFNMIALSGVRKEIALGFSILAFLYYVDKKYVRMAIAIVVGTTIHMSTLLFLLVPLLGVLKPKLLRTIHLSAFFTVPFVIAFSGAIIVFMGESVGNEKYVGYGLEGARGGAMTFVVLIELLSLFCFIAFRNIDLNKGTILSKLYVMLPCFTFFAPLITNNGSMIRISQYFHVYLLVLLPMAVECIASKKDIQLILYGVMSIVLITLSLTSQNFEYCFFWQDQYSNLFVNKSF